MGIWTSCGRDFGLLVAYIIFCALIQQGVMGGPTIRGFFKNDSSIALPMARPETVTSVALVLFSFALPLLALITTWFLIDRVHEPTFEKNDIEEASLNEEFTSVPHLIALNQNSSKPLYNNEMSSSGNQIQPIELGEKVQKTPSYRAWTEAFISSLSSHWGSNVIQSPSPRSRKIRFVLFQLFTFLFFCATNVLVTDTIKLVVGRLRPDFISRCEPNWAKVDAVMDPVTLFVAPEFVSTVCMGKEKDITEGRKSFPSGHSSCSLFAALFIVILLQKRTVNRVKRAFGYFLVPLLQVALVCSALLIGASRSKDNRHHALDILLGFTIGGLSAFACLLLPSAFTPSWEQDGTLVKKETDEEAASTVQV